MLRQKKQKKANGGNQPAKFVTNEKYYILKNEMLTKLKKKEVKKLGLAKDMNK